MNVLFSHASRQSNDLEALASNRGGRRDVLVVLSVTLLALALRCCALGHESIWTDESASLDLARHSAADLLSGRAADAGNPAGYFLLLHFWLQLFGSGSIEAARALSAVAGALSVPAVWLLARVTGLSRRAGWMAMLLVAISPPLVYLGQEARTFALFATVATLAVALVALIERSDRWAAWLGFTMSGMILIHLHYYGFFVLLVLGLELLAWAWGRSWRALGKLALSSTATALAFAAYLPTFLWQLQQGTARSEETWRQQLAVFPLFSAVGRTLVWKDDGMPAVIAVDAAIAVAVFLPLAWLLWRWRAAPRLVVTFVVGVPLVATLASLGLSPMIHVHYLSVVLPALLVLAACALDTGLRQRCGVLVWGPAALLAVLLPASLARLYAAPHKNDWRGVAALVERQAPELPVYFYEDTGASAFHYYSPEQPDRLLVKSFGRNGDGWRQAHYLEQMRGETKGFWIVLYTPTAVARADEAAIRTLLENDYRIQRQEQISSIRVLLCRPF